MTRPTFPLVEGPRLWTVPAAQALLRSVRAPVPPAEQRRPEVVRAALWLAARVVDAPESREATR